MDCRRFWLNAIPTPSKALEPRGFDEVTPGFKFNLRQRPLSLLPQLNPPWWLSHQSPAEVSWCSPPPVILSRTAHRTRTHTRHTDPHGTRDMHTEPHGTSTRDTHTMFSSLHIKLSCVCGLVSWFISPVGFGVRMLATSVKGGAIPHGHLGTRHEHADIQANAELTGFLVQNLHTACSRCRCRA